MTDQASTAVTPDLQTTHLVVRCQKCARRHPNRKPTIVGFVSLEDFRERGLGIKAYVSRLHRYGESEHGPEYGSGSHAWEMKLVPDDRRTGLPKVGALSCRSCGHRVQGPAQRFLDEALHAAVRDAKSLYA